MTSNFSPPELFTTWSTHFEVRVDRAAEKLIFEPARVDGRHLRPKSLFDRPGSGESHYHKLITTMLSLNSKSTDRQWQAAAVALGPLIQRHPMQHAALGLDLSESMAQWQTASRELAALWEDVQNLASAPTQSLSEEERVEVALDRLAAAGFPVEGMSAAQLQPHLAPYLPAPSDSEAQELHARIGNRLNRWFQSKHPRISPLLNPVTHEIEIVVEQGIQALFLMSVALARNDLAAFPRKCARPRCTRIAFMKGRKRYCSIRCQEAEKTARSRRKMQADLA